ncbi:uncharacterized protein LOC141905477 [Tubulanus polymorphus]|uniref:uncharacterized protein LOC141905477 n=1 Tax=Tubulanus polymorphus TaxID=672921 RepID=UPI003DA54FFA
MNRSKAKNAEAVLQRKREAHRRKRRLAYVPKFPGLINQATTVHNTNSDLHDELTDFHARSCLTDERRLTMETECREIIRALMPAVKRNTFHLRFFEAALPDFNTVEVLGATEVDVLLPLETCRHKVEYLEPGYSSVLIKKPLDEDNEEGGWANLNELFKKHLSRDTKYVSPILVVKVVHSILTAAINKVSGTTVVFDESSKQTDPSTAACFRTASARSNLSRASTRKMTKSPAGNRKPSLKRNSPSCVIRKPEIAKQATLFDNHSIIADDDVNGTANDDLSCGNDVMTNDKDGRLAASDDHKQSQLDTTKGNTLKVPDIQTPPKSASNQSIAGEEITVPSPEITRRLVLIENVSISDFIIDKTKGALIQIKYQSIVLNIIPALPIIDEFGSHSFLVTKPFEYDAVPKSHKRWRHCHLLKERKLFQAMKYADQGIRTQAVEAMYGLTRVDQALFDISPIFIKTAMFHAFDEEVDITPRWQRQDLESIFKTLLRELLNYVTTQNLPSFFERGHNLISGFQTNNLVRVRSRLALLCSSEAALRRALKARLIDKFQQVSVI